MRIGKCKKCGKEFTKDDEVYEIPYEKTKINGGTVTVKRWEVKWCGDCLNEWALESHKRNSLDYAEMLIRELKK